MMVVVSYDVSTTTKSGKKRLKKVADTCLNFGIRAQNSVFECIIDPAQWEVLKNELLTIFKEDEDSLRFYYLGSNYQRRIESFGKSKNLNIDDTLIL
ncbi:MAG: CRISPR-associated endonuclease Cas2 [Ignavibacterium sp.]|jgi:CRISPR-associated protein Cas2|nr:CRISPR-associated endonuclease Cas2 [Ignavibacterium sp.]